MGRKKSSEGEGGKKKGKSVKKPADTVKELFPSFGRGGLEGSIFRRQKQSPLDQAQDLIYEAWETGGKEKRVAMALKALEISSDCADAYVILAEEAATSLEEIIEYYRKGVEAGERAIGKRAFREDVGYFWGLLETRPYMRARHGLAMSLWKAGRSEEAADIYRDMLRLNPNDNQGIRCLLAPCLLEMGRDEELADLLRQYEGDISADWAYAEALLFFRKEGDTKRSRGKLTDALEANPHVPSYLLKKKKMPRRLPDYVGHGDQNEAICYVDLNMNAWRTTPGALEWLKANIE